MGVAVTLVMVRALTFLTVASGYGSDTTSDFRDRRSVGKQGRESWIVILRLHGQERRGSHPPGRNFRQYRHCH